MGAIALALLRPLIEAALVAFGRTIVDMVGAWRANADAKSLGRADAVADAQAAAMAAEREMGAVTLPEADELLRRLREGSA